MNAKIKLSNLVYFTQGNIWCGSCTPEDLVGELLAPIFNYRVYCNDNKELEAMYFVDNKCFALTDKDKIVKNSFELSDNGIGDAIRWLEDEYKKYVRTV